MNSGGPIEGEKRQGGDNPAEAYAHRLRALSLAQVSAQRRERILGYVKLIVAFAVVAVALLGFRCVTALYMLPAPIILFVVLAARHEKVLRSIRLRERTIVFYERGIARIEDRWAGTGETGDRFLDPAHPYARDLDLFGNASVFELLNTARTRAGEETLARWLLAAAPVDEILARQSAVDEIRDRVKLREDLFSLGETVRAGVRPETLAAWGERTTVVGTPRVVALTTMLGILWLVSVVSWGAWGSYECFAVTSMLNFAYAHWFYTRIDEAADAVERAAEDLELLTGALALLEREPFSSPKLIELHHALLRDGVKPSAAIRKLSRTVESLKSRRNPFGKSLAPFTFWTAQLVFATERWQREFGPAIRGWLAALGEVEAITALAGYAYEHPQDVFPEFVAALPLFDAEGLAHPLLPAGKAVRNDVKLGDGLQLIVLSGPNMAGKSTFIRSIGVNAVLAQCGAPVRATRLRLSPVQVAASICVLDSLSGAMSRFYAEIHRVKLISDLARGPAPVLFLLDELLSGTNSHDRRVGTEFIVRSLMEQNALGIVSTHDLALAEIPSTVGERAINCHFEDRLEDEQLIFDYELKPGVVQTSNALKLMRSIGLGVTE
jgi:hypothetical protein